MKVCLAGCGVAMPLHMLGLDAIKEAQVVAVCDRDIGKARAAAVRYRVQGVYADVDEMLEKERPDVVHVMTPPPTHRDIGLRALEAGCHLLMEKPTAASVGQCDELIQASAKADRMLCLMHNHLFDPNVHPFRDLAVVEAKTGPLEFVRVAYCLDSDKMKEEGHDDPEHWVHKLPLGIFSEYSPHQLYLALNWLVDVSEADLKMIERDGPFRAKQHVFHASLVGSNALGSITMVDQTDHGFFVIDLLGRRGVLHINMMDLTAVLAREPHVERRLNKILRSCSVGARTISANVANVVRIAVGRLKPRPGHRRLIAAFYNALATGGPPPVSGKEGREVIRVHELLCQSASRHVQPSQHGPQACMRPSVGVP